MIGVGGARRAVRCRRPGRIVPLAEHGLQVGVSEAFADGGQADPAVETGGGVGVSKLVQRRGNPCGVAILGPAGLGGGVAQRASAVVFLRAEQRTRPVAGGGVGHRGDRARHPMQEGAVQPPSDIRCSRLLKTSSPGSLRSSRPGICLRLTSPIPRTEPTSEPGALALGDRSDRRSSIGRGRV